MSIIICYAKALFVARLCQDFSRCVGIEILAGLHQQARVIVDRYRTEYNIAATIYIYIINYASIIFELYHTYTF